MKKITAIALIVLPLILSACASRKANASDGSLPPEGISGPEIATTLPESGGGASEQGSSEGGAASTITFDDNGKTFTYKVGDSFVLNLGADIYDWEVTLESQDVFAFNSGETTQDAQGTFTALKLGTVLLTAVGNPKCLKSTPPCGMPTVLFKVTLIVE